MNLKNKKILLVGGYGFIGLNLAIELQRKGAEVIIPGNQQFNMTPFTTYFCDIKKYSNLKEIALKTSIDYVVHCAENTNRIQYEKEPISVIEENVVLDLNIMRLLQDKLVKGALFIKTDERNMLQEIPFKLSKLNELPVKHLEINSEIYGPQDFREGHFFYELFKHCITGDSMNYKKYGCSKRIVFVSDVVKHIMYILENLEKAEQTTEYELGHTIKKNKFKKMIEYITNKELKEVSKGFPSFDLIPLPTKDLANLEQTLDATYKWYLAAFQPK